MTRIMDTLKPFDPKQSYSKATEVMVKDYIGYHSKPILPSDPQERKKYPVGTGVLDYFPAAIAEVSTVSWAGNEQHNPGEPLHWSRGKSTDQADTMIRHFIDRGTRDVDGQRHSAKMVWRALAILQLELEAEGAPVARGTKLPDASPQKFQVAPYTQYTRGSK